MRAHRPTTRRIMALISVLAVAFGLGVPAVRVGRAGGGHAHSWPVSVRLPPVPGFAGGCFDSSVRATLTASESVAAPFWPRYWRALTGHPGGADPACGVSLGHPGETCSAGPAGAKVGAR